MATIQHAAQIVAAYVSKNSLSPSEVPKLIAATYASLVALDNPAAPPAPELVPAIAPKKSVTRDFIISLENGKQFKTLKKHLSVLGMTPDEYRVKWGLSHDYPMVAPAYAERRSQLAKSLGLGRKPKVVEPEPEPAPAKPARRKSKKQA